MPAVWEEKIPKIVHNTPCHDNPSMQMNEMSIKAFNSIHPDFYIAFFYCIKVKMLAEQWPQSVKWRRCNGTGNEKPVVRPKVVSTH